MIPMRLVVLCMLVFWSISLNAQLQVFYDVSYLKKSNFSNQETKQDKSAVNIYKQFIAIMSESEGVLVACNNQSYFKIEPAPTSVIDSNALAVVFINQSSWLTSSKGSGNIDRKRKALVMSDYNLNDWSVDYTIKKVIAGYNCFRATKNLVFKDSPSLNSTLEVWFTPDVAVTSGLRDATDLPGLILYYNDETWEFKAKSVKQIKKCNIDIPDLNKISFTENEQLAKQRMDDRRNRKK